MPTNESNVHTMYSLMLTSDTAHVVTAEMQHRIYDHAVSIADTTLLRKLAEYSGLVKEIDNLYKLISCLPSYNSDPKFGIVQEHSLGTLINFLVNKLSCMNLFEDMRPIYRSNQKIFNKLYC